MSVGMIFGSNAGRFGRRAFHKGTGGSSACAEGGLLSTVWFRFFFHSRTMSYRNIILTGTGFFVEYILYITSLFSVICSGSSVLVTRNRNSSSSSLPFGATSSTTLQRIYQSVFGLTSWRRG